MLKDNHALPQQTVYRSWPLAIMVGVVLWSCGSSPKANQCHQVKETVNRFSEQATLTTKAATLQRADQYRGLAQRLEQLVISDASLKPFTQQLAKAYRDASAATMEEAQWMQEDGHVILRMDQKPAFEAMRDRQNQASASVAQQIRSIADYCAFP